ncbi:hypothetical protein [Butyricicoccus intestinisimiae]|uniref:Uncharacterized protein n=1 Tax=Butyricicoccus intestinisimiae TaxID=2841509 RepID=A0ABS6EXM4_9FIRM|nr:hypothetical protein [Butyricicoccus intestinisimiae]MBU5491574.1 hypothetical protein [Butyricicoccus intestinisimiae]
MTDAERKNKFIDYLSDKFSERKANDIIYALERSEATMLKKHYISCRLYEIEQPNEISSAMLAISKNRFFRFYNRKIYPQIEIGMKNYREFLQAIIEQKLVEKARITEEVHIAEEKRRAKETCIEEEKKCVMKAQIVEEEGEAAEKEKPIRSIIWHEDEVELLIDTFYAIQAGKIKRFDAIKILSKELRRRAEKDYRVPEDFRSIRSVTTFLASVEYYCTNGQSGLQTTSSLIERVLEKKRHDEKIISLTTYTAPKGVKEIPIELENGVDSKRIEPVRILIIGTQSFKLDEVNSTIFTMSSKPVSINILGNDYECKNWKELYTVFCKIMFKKYFSHFIKYVNSSFSGRGNIDLADTNHFYRMTDPVKIGSYGDNTIYFERLHAPTNIISHMKKISEICSVDLSEIKILISGEYSQKKILESHESDGIKIFDRTQSKITSAYQAIEKSNEKLSNQEVFYKWLLSQGFKESSAKGYVSTLNSFGEILNEEGIIGKSIFQIITENELLKLREAMGTKCTRYQQRRFGSPFRKYCNYCETQMTDGNVRSKEATAAKKESIEEDDLTGKERTEQSRDLKFTEKSQEHSNGDDNVIVSTKVMDSIQKTDVMTDYLELHNIPYIDNRKKGGALWIIGGLELKDTIAQFQKNGAKCVFMKKGGHATKGKDAWWTRSVITEPIFSQLPDDVTEKLEKSDEDMLSTHVGEVCKEIENLINGLQENTGLSRSNRQQKNRLDDELTKHKNFMGEYQNNSSVTSGPRNDIIKQDTVVSVSEQIEFSLHSEPKVQDKSFDLSNNVYYSVLKQRFSKGFRVNSGIALKQFKKQYANAYGKELEISNEELLDEIRKITVQHEDRLYLLDTMLSEDKKQKLLQYIRTTFAKGKSAIYYTALFEWFSDDFLGEKIYTSDMLKTYLKHINDGGYVINRLYLAKDKNVRVAPLDEIIEFLCQKKDAPVTIEQICQELPHLPKDLIESNLKSSAEIICNKRGESYFHVSAIDLDDTELEHIARIIQHAIDTQQFETSSEMYAEVRAQYPDIIERYGEISPNGFRDAMAYYFRDRFTFSKNVICPHGVILKTSDIYANFAKTRDHFTIGELNLLRSELDAVINFDKVYENALRISQNDFVSLHTISFDVAKTDEAIGQYCTGEYIPLKDVDDFSSFPYVGVTWNIYLLEQFVFMFSEKYKLIHTGFTAGSSSGAIVRKESKIDTLDKLLTAELAESGHIASVNDAFNYLIEKGYLVGRGIQRMDKIVVDAKVQRSRRG